MHTNPWKLDFSAGEGGSRMCWRDVSPFLVWEIIKTRNTGVNQRAFLDCAHYASARRSPWSAHNSFCLAWGRCSEHAESVPVVALLFHSVCACLCLGVLCSYTRLLISRTKATSGDLRVSHRGRGVFFTSCLALVVSRARGEVLYPLMNWDCWSKVWIIEFLINYPELLSDKSAPLQPPSPRPFFFCGVLFDLVCVLLPWACPSLSLPHQRWPCHGDWCCCVFSDVSGGFCSLIWCFAGLCCLPQPW